MPVPPRLPHPERRGGFTTRDRDGPLTKREEASLGGFPDPLPCPSHGPHAPEIGVEAVRRGDNPFAFASFLPFGPPLSP